MRQITGTYSVRYGFLISFIPNIDLSPDEVSEITANLKQIGVRFEMPEGTCIFHITYDDPDKTDKCIEYAKLIGLSQVKTMVGAIDYVMKLLQQRHPRRTQGPNGELLVSKDGWQRGEDESSGNYFIGSPLHFQSCGIVPRIVWEPPGPGEEKWTPAQRVVPMKVHVWGSFADTKFIEALRSCFTDEELVDAEEVYEKWSNPSSTPQTHFKLSIRFTLENPPLSKMPEIIRHQAS